MASPPPPGAQPTPEQMAQMQAQIALEAQKRGLSPQEFQRQQRQHLEEEARKAGLSFEQYITRLKQQAFENHQRQQQAIAQQQQQQQHGGGGQVQGGQGQQVPITPGQPDPKALALAKWLRGQDLKTRTCILNGQRKDLFRIKRALRALQSPAYTKAASAKKSQLPPPPTTAQEATETFKLLPLSLLALRVSKSDPHAGHNHDAAAKSPKRVKGLWTVTIEQQQDIREDLHYVWLYEGPQWRMKLYAGGALVAIMGVVMFPLWPVKLRVGVWYLSMAFLGLIGLFFAMAIVRLIIFCVTVVTMPRGFWLYPNLFEDVGFFDSFKPVWGWQEEKAKGKKSKSSKTSSKISNSTEITSTTSSNPTQGIEITKRAHAAPRVEEVEDE